jgi:hypothetical protein
MVGRAIIPGANPVLEVDNAVFAQCSGSIMSGGGPRPRILRRWAGITSERAATQFQVAQCGARHSRFDAFNPRTRFSSFCLPQTLPAPPASVKRLQSGGLGANRAGAVRCKHGVDDVSGIFG